MGDLTSKPKAASSGAILRRRRPAVAALRRDRRDDEARAIPDWGRIVLRSGTATPR